MFKVYRNKRKATSLTFETYEKARQFVRRRLRTHTDLRWRNQPDAPMWLFDYEIRRV